MPLAGSLTVVPGLGLDARSWGPTLGALGVDDAAVRTLPGYGRPVRPVDPVSVAALGDRLLGELPSTPVVLCGHSSSCQVVLQAARTDPGRFAGLVLVGPTTDPRARTWPRLAARWLRTAVHEDPRQVPALASQYRRTTLRSMRRVMDQARRDDALATIAAVTAPVLLVRGRRDRICPASWLELLAADAGGPARAVTLPSGAHMVPTTDPDPLAGLLTEFVRGLPGPPA